MENIIKIKVVMECTEQTAFDFFIKNELLEGWLTEKADVEPIIGGKYELYWEPENRENNSTIGCRITGFEKGKFISFDWKGPIQFNPFMNSADPLTHVIVFFSPHNTIPNNTVIHLFHTGWKEGLEWEKARNYFENAWTNALKGLQEKIKNKILP